MVHNFIFDVQINLKIMIIIFICIVLKGVYFIIVAVHEQSWTKYQKFKTRSFDFILNKSYAWIYHKTILYVQVWFLFVD